MIDKFEVVLEDLHRRYDNSCGAADDVEVHIKKLLKEMGVR